MSLGLPVIAAVAGVLGAALGVGLRLTISPSERARQAESMDEGGEPSAHAATHMIAEETAAHSEKGKINEMKKLAADHKKPSEAGSYFKFSRQFVAPIVREGGPEAMIVLDVVLELTPDSAESHYAIEPKLRDAVLRALLAQSGKGELKGMLSDPSLLESTRETILASVQEVIGDNARAVLLLDVAYQPF